VEPAVRVELGDSGEAVTFKDALARGVAVRDAGKDIGRSERLLCVIDDRGDSRGCDRQARVVLAYPVTKPVPGRMDRDEIDPADQLVGCEDPEHHRRVRISGERGGLLCFRSADVVGIIRSEVVGVALQQCAVCACIKRQQRAQYCTFNAQRDRQARHRVSLSCCRARTAKIFPATHCVPLYLIAIAAVLFGLVVSTIAARLTAQSLRRLPAAHLLADE